MCRNWPSHVDIISIKIPPIMLGLYFCLLHRLGFVMLVQGYFFLVNKVNSLKPGYAWCISELNRHEFRKKLGFTQKAITWMNGNIWVLITTQLEFVLGGFNWQWFSIGSGNGLRMDRRQAIAWTNDNAAHWHLYASNGLNEFIGCLWINLIEIRTSNIPVWTTTFKVSVLQINVPVYPSMMSGIKLC